MNEKITDGITDGIWRASVTKGTVTIPHYGVSHTGWHCAVIAGDPALLIALTGPLDTEAAAYDANLIAAAPQLLEAVRLFVKYDDSDHGQLETMLNYDNAVTAARAVLRKIDAHKESEE